MFIVNDAQLFCQQEQEKERELLEDRLTTIKNYDAEATKRMKELRESMLLIEKKEVRWLCSKITAGDWIASFPGPASFSLLAVRKSGESLVSFLM